MNASQGQWVTNVTSWKYQRFHRVHENDYQNWVETDVWSDSMGPYPEDRVQDYLPDLYRLQNGPNAKLLVFDGPYRPVPRSGLYWKHKCRCM